MCARWTSNPTSLGGCIDKRTSETNFLQQNHDKYYYSGQAFSAEAWFSLSLVSGDWLCSHFNPRFEGGLGVVDYFTMMIWTRIAALWRAICI